ncbi:MAG: hypothetical protein NW200_04145 [Hyphomonadaceae bacterium]|nr:hypothetical protein [Hyphomonadaceae bacterium]
MSAADLLRLIASLFAALFAPAHMLARVAGFDARRLRSFARLLQRLKARGRALAYAGEDDATIQKRIDRAAWIAADPVGAMKHMVRSHRGLLRLRFGMVAPADDAPPILAVAALCAGPVDAAHADTS